MYHKTKRSFYLAFSAGIHICRNILPGYFRFQKMCGSRKQSAMFSVNICKIHTFILKVIWYIHIVFRKEFCPDASYSDTCCFDYYGAFLLLDGCGYHID